MAEKEELDEFETLLEHTVDLAYHSRRSYKTNYKKLRKMIGDSDVNMCSQEIICKEAKDMANAHSRAAVLNLAIIIKRLYEKDDKILIVAREKNRHSIEKRVAHKNRDLKLILPEYDTIVKYMNDKYENNEWTDYIINYLLINFQTRNQDLNFEIVDLKKDIKENLNKNYIWYNKNYDNVLYVRNVYKTASTYGQKTNTISDPKFVVALKRVIARQKHDEAGGEFIPNENNMSYFIKKATYKELGETNYIKIILNHFTDSISKHEEIAENRGTDITTLREYYNINKI